MVHDFNKPPHVTSAECCLAELSAYNYKVDSNGDPTTVIDDASNH